MLLLCNPSFNRAAIHILLLGVTVVEQNEQDALRRAFVHKVDMGPWLSVTTARRLLSYMQPLGRRPSLPSAPVAGASSSIHSRYHGGDQGGGPTVL
jgi:hypothetical protein